MRLLLLLVLSFSVSTIWAGDKEKETTNNAKKPVKVEQPYVKSKGKPADPGAHGRANAASKQAANPDKGSKQNENLEIMPVTDTSKGKKEKEKNKKKEKSDKS